MFKNRILSYENSLLVLMSVANGFIALDRAAINFLSPFIIKEFDLSNTELGLLSTAFSTTAAISGIVLCSLADRSGKRKHLFLTAFALFSLLSVVTGLASSFGLLIVARTVMGMTSGPLAPTAQSILYLESSEHRRGFNMGFLQNVGVYLIGMMLGPIICTQIGSALGWRPTFFLSGIPAGFVFILLLFLVRNPKPPEAATETSRTVDTRRFLLRLRELLSSRNLLLCLLISSMCSSWLLVQFTFMPRYLTDIDGLSPANAGLLMSLIGISGAVGGVLVSALSDRLGRRPLLAIAAFGGVVAPLVLLLVRDQIAVLGIGIFIGWLAGSAGPLYLAIIPTESVSPQLGATAVAITLGVGEVVGGIIAPAVAGIAADIYGLGAPFIMAIIFAVLSGFLALFLQETAPALRQPGMARAA